MYKGFGHQQLEMNAVKNLKTLGMGAVVATAAFSLFALTANAQQPPAAAPAAPAATKPATLPPAAAPATAKAPAPATAPAATKPAAAATPAKKPAKSACAGLDETGCKANPECGYIVPTAVNAKTGKPTAPYCRKVAGVAKPKAAAATASAPGSTAKPAAAATAAKPAAATAVKPAAPASAPAPAATKQ
jgi:hypothetical protein